MLTSSSLQHASLPGSSEIQLSALRDRKLRIRQPIHSLCVRQIENYRLRIINI